MMRKSWMLEMLSNLDERSAEASEFAMERQRDRIEQRTLGGKDADESSFLPRKDGKKPKVAGKELLSSLTVRTSSMGDGSESSLGASGKASAILASQNGRRRFFAFGIGDQAKVAADYVGKLLGK